MGPYFFASKRKLYVYYIEINTYPVTKTDINIHPVTYSFVSVIYSLVKLIAV